MHSLPLFFQRFGTPHTEIPPLLILHGLFGASGNWRSIAQRLAKSRQVFALDLRNHGQSPWADAMHYPAMVADVAHFLPQQRLDRIDLLGHSMGGKVAMYLAQTQFPIRKLIVADIAPVPYPTQEHADLIAAMQSCENHTLATAQNRADIERALSQSIPHPGIRAFLIQNALPDPNRGYRWRLNLRALEKYLDQICAYPDDAIAARPAQTETLFLHGGDSAYLGAAQKPYCTALFPNADFHAIANAGHWLHAQAPDQFIRRCEAFLAG